MFLPISNKQHDFALFISIFLIAISFKLKNEMNIRTFTASDVAIIMQNISGIRMMLPNHVKLKPEVRRSMFKLNSKKQAFAEAALKYMQTKPDTVPQHINVTTCNNYLQLYLQYVELINELEKIKRLMEDVKLQLGNEVMNMTKAYFHNARFASQSGVVSSEIIYQQLKKKYAVGRNSKKNNSAETV